MSAWQPRPVEAIQWCGDNTAAVIAFGESHAAQIEPVAEFMGRSGAMLAVSQTSVFPLGDKTSSFRMTTSAVAGDFIVAGAQGVRVVSADEFLLTHQEVVG